MMPDGAPHVGLNWCRSRGVWLISAIIFRNDNEIFRDPAAMCVVETRFFSHDVKKKNETVLVYGSQGESRTAEWQVQRSGVRNVCMLIRVDAGNTEEKHRVKVRRNCTKLCVYTLKKVGHGCIVSHRVHTKLASSPAIMELPVGRMRVLAAARTCTHNNFADSHT